MLETPSSVRVNQRNAIVIAVLLGAAVLMLATVSPVWLICLPLVPLAYWWWRRRTLRRLRVMAEPFPGELEAALRQQVA
ncbi:hypothetical protein Enr13x_29480 [Stieleria neptunia]|uniref:Uncharacterized protein n=1 Tax=Stieleria neptunia TaxID=2527979 RepID=A0A518HQG0_9BACT|nr:hypothetical protein [Stieleria neptunia]QDV43094.1 hypothetical protein Enr13x_29480 [Stieleria neptunia]